MSMKLNFNLSVTPETVPVVDPGEYDGTIEKIESQEASGKRLSQVSFTIKITSDGPMKGRVMFDGFPFDYLADAASATSVKLGHLVRSSGYVPENPAELDMDQLLNKTIKFTVTHKNGTDSDGTAKSFANIKDYLYTK